MALRQILHDILPPAVDRAGRAAWRRMRSGSAGTIRFTGPYASWDEASRHASGDGSEVILERVTAGALEVKEGRAAFERDSVVFHQKEYSFPLLAALLHAALAEGGRLTVLDFGGSLGSSYFQHRDFLHEVRPLRWCVVEQEQFVARGRERFQDEQLRFYASIEACLREESPTLALFSAVLQYLPGVSAILADVLKRRFRYIVVDNTPFSNAGGERILVQHVPPEIYAASYPFRVFDRERFLTAMSADYDVLAEFPGMAFPALERKGDAAYRGFIFTLRQP